MNTGLRTLNALCMAMAMCAATACEEAHSTYDADDKRRFSSPSFESRASAQEQPADRGGSSASEEVVSAASTSTACATGAPFNGTCVTSRNAEQLLGLGDDNNILGVSTCKDDDGRTIIDCAMVHIDEGDGPELTYQYLVTTDVCAPSHASGTHCVGDYATPYRKKIEVSDTASYLDRFTSMIETGQMSRAARPGRLGPYRATWQDIGYTVHDVTVTPGPYRSSPVDIEVTIAQYNTDGEELSHDALTVSIIEDRERPDLSARELAVCESLKEDRTNYQNGAEGAAEQLCSVINYVGSWAMSWYPSTSVDIFGLEVSQNVGASGNLHDCQAIGATMRAMTHEFTTDRYQTCVQQPGAYATMRNMPLWGSLDIFGNWEGIFPKDAVAGGDCDSLDGTIWQASYTKVIDGENHTCTQTVEMQCSDNGGDTCDCMGLPNGNPRCVKTEK